MSELSDELLVAHVDGQLARDQSAAVQRVIDFDGLAAKRVASLSSARERLETAFQDMLEADSGAIQTDGSIGLKKSPHRIIGFWADLSKQMRSMCLGQTTSAPAAEECAQAGGEPASAAAPPEIQGRPTTPIVAAAAAAFVAIGGGIGYLAHGVIGSLDGSANTAAGLIGAPQWKAELTQSQALMGRESLEMSIEDQANRDLVRFQLAGAIGRDIVIPDLDAQGFRFIRAQLLRRSGEAIAQIAYLSREGLPIAIYAKAHNEGAVQFGAYQAGGIRSQAWVHNGIAYVLATGLNEQQMETLASRVRRRIEANRND